MSILRSAFVVAVFCHCWLIVEQKRASARVDNLIEARRECLLRQEAWVESYSANFSKLVASLHQMQAELDELRVQVREGSLASMSARFANITSTPVDRAVKLATSAALVYFGARN
jgi:hypothetical protein